LHLNAHLDLSVVAHESDDELSVLVELTAPEAPDASKRPPATVVVMLDHSGSMEGDRLDNAKAALLALVDKLAPTDQFGLVTFDHEVTVVVPTHPVTDRKRTTRAIMSVQSGGSTDLSSGYLRGLQEARRAASSTGAAIILISDGHANEGLCDPAALGDIARKAHAEGIATSTLGLGLGYDECLLSAIAAGGNGNELFAEGADDAIPLMLGEVDGLLSTSAQAGSLLVRMSPHVRGVQIVNDLSWTGVPGVGVLLELGSFYAGEKRKLVLTFDVPGIDALGLAEVATLEFSYLALPSLEQHTVVLPLHVNVVPGDQAAGRIPDPVVRVELAFQQAQRSKRAASAALSVGDVASASASIQTARDVLDAACSSAPGEMTGELLDELLALSHLEQQAIAGNIAHAAKLSSVDASLKSRNRGRALLSQSLGDEAHQRMTEWFESTSYVEEYEGLPEVDDPDDE
jgi:Ca-activated chloride channel family protein